MEKVTAVQWCAGKLGDLEFYNSIGNFTAIEYIEEKIKIIEQAKEMEAEKDAKYNEMLEMLKCLIRVAQIEPDLYYEVRRLIKKSTNLKSE
jgi:hypothetical protein